MKLNPRPPQHLPVPAYCGQKRLSSWNRHDCVRHIADHGIHTPGEELCSALRAVHGVAQKGMTGTFDRAGVRLREQLVIAHNGRSTKILHLETPVLAKCFDKITS